MLIRWKTHVRENVFTTERIGSPVIMVGPDGESDTIIAHKIKAVHEGDDRGGRELLISWMNLGQAFLHGGELYVKNDSTRNTAVDMNGRVKGFDATETGKKVDLKGVLYEFNVRD